jgi:hypothetical protein
VGHTVKDMKDSSLKFSRLNLGMEFNLGARQNYRIKAKEERSQFAWIMKYHKNPNKVAICLQGENLQTHLEDKEGKKV